MAYVSQDYRIRYLSGQQNFYFQQRFNSVDVNDTATVGAYLLAHASTGAWNMEEVIDLLRLRHLLQASLLMLSNGETRRLSLALGLLKQPRLFLMDQPLTGLDKESRAAFGDFLDSCIAKGIHLLLTTTAQEVPSQVTHVGHLNEIGECITWARDNYPLPASVSEPLPWALMQLAHLLPPTAAKEGLVLAMEKVTIRYGEKVILQNLDWKIATGERWRLHGRNGSGKSTLLSLLIGENPQAYSQNFSLFGKKRGSGESIWELKRPIGFVAPELTRFFPRNQTLRKVILSGLFDTLGLFKAVTPAEEALGAAWISFFQLGPLTNTFLYQLSLEQQRWALLARALIKNPRLLILDEATQGMDQGQRQLFRDSIQYLLEHRPLTLIYVSHYDEDVPSSVNRVFELP